MPLSELCVPEREPWTNFREVVAGNLSVSFQQTTNSKHDEYSTGTLRFISERQYLMEETWRKVHPAANYG